LVLKKLGAFSIMALYTTLLPQYLSTLEIIFILEIGEIHAGFEWLCREFTIYYLMFVDFIALYIFT
jgi:hypothetical protein